jgi:hypothetical protein
MKIKNLIIAAMITVTSANASDELQLSMYKMEQGMNQIQIGFIHHSKDSIANGVKMIKDGMTIYSHGNDFKKFLPEGKKHLSNVAKNSAKNVLASLNVVEANVDIKNIKKAAQAYGDTMNACAKCHSIVRSW